MSRIDAVSIISGTAIGGGFLALPAVTTPLGYLPAVCGLVAIWALLVLAGIAFVEAAGRVLAAEGESATISHASVIRRAFGPMRSRLAGLAFLAQMTACVTAQVVKGAEFLNVLFAVPYTLACLLPTCLVGVFTFSARPSVVERANTALTAALIGGFGLLIGSAISLSSGADVASRLLSTAQWGGLLPSLSAGAWAVPIFVNLLCFTQSVPLVVERLAAHTMHGTDEAAAAHDATDAATNADDGAPHDTVGSELAAQVGMSEQALQVAQATQAAHAREAALQVRASALQRALHQARMAVVVGSAIPLGLSLIWAAIASSLVSPSAVAAGVDPLFALLARGPAIAAPVGLLAVGAIGTTLLSSFMATAHYASDLVCTWLGYCSLRAMWVCRVAIVLGPCLLACAGPSLYLPLLAFAGAFPTTLLYLLAPPLAALALRQGAHDQRSLLPGGVGTMRALAAAAATMLGANVLLALRRLVPV